MRRTYWIVIVGAIGLLLAVANVAFVQPPSPVPTRGPAPLCQSYADCGYREKCIGGGCQAF